MMDDNINIQVFGSGVYSIPEASRLAKIPQQQLRRWLRGGGKTVAVWHSDFEQLGDNLELSFVDLMEARIVHALRTEGVSLQHIRKARDIAKQQFELEKPFSTGRFQTDGKRVFWEAARALKEEDPSLEDLSTGQMVFWSVVQQTFKSIDIEEGVARRWWPQRRKRSVVVDPERSFGQPILAEFGIPTTAVCRSFLAEQSIPKVARLFEISTKDVQDALDFEEKLAA